MRTVFIHGLNSKFNSIFEVPETGRDSQYGPNSSYFLESIPLLVKLDHLEEESIRDKPLNEIV